MSIKQKNEVFTSGCSVCTEAVDLINTLACSECEIIVLDMHDEKVASKAKELGIKSIPAAVLDATLATCCSGRGVNESSLRAAGLIFPMNT